jgi:hypothetical protein
VREAADWRNLAGLLLFAAGGKITVLRSHAVKWNPADWTLTRTEWPADGSVTFTLAALAAEGEPDELRTVATQVLARLDAWLISEDVERGMTKEMVVLSHIVMDLRKALKA